MSKAINRKDYSKIKRIVDQYDTLDSRTIGLLLEDLGYSEKTFRRIKKSRNFGHYKAIIRRGYAGKELGASSRQFQRYSKRVLLNNQIVFFVVGLIIGMALALAVAELTK